MAEKETETATADSGTQKEKAKAEQPHCGVIMPISGTPDYPASHWADMLQLVQEAAKAAKFTCEIVSATGRDDIIHTSIVTNIYQNEMVICDVSSRNPNVMLELGLRLASKLPVIIIFDGQGSYPFDIGTIRYLPYPKDMRYYDMEKFKKDLTAKILEVYDTYKKGAYKSFLSHFKSINFDLDSITTETQSLSQFLESLEQRLSKFESYNNFTKAPASVDEVAYTADNQLEEYLDRYTINNKLPPGKIPSNLVKKVVEDIISAKKYPMSYMNPDYILNAVREFEWVPF